MKRRTRIRSWLGLAAFSITALSAAAISCGAQSASSSANQTTPGLKAFLGTWTATYRGEIFAVLVIRESRGGLAGTLNNFDMTFDKDGSLADGTHKDQGEAPLLNARLKDGALLFVVMQKDQYAPSTDWKFVPKSSREGELTPLLDHQLNLPKDVVARPIPMIRERTKS